MRWLIAVQKLPVIKQFALMQSCPLQDHPQRSSWKSPAQHGQRINADFHLFTDVNRMERGWIVVIVGHANGDAEKRLTSGMPHPLPSITTTTNQHTTGLDRHQAPPRGVAQARALTRSCRTVLRTLAGPKRPPVPLNAVNPFSISILKLLGVLSLGCGGGGDVGGGRVGSLVSCGGSCGCFCGGGCSHR